MEKNLKFVALAAVAGLLGFSSARAAQSIPVDNFSFESPDAQGFVAVGAASWNTNSANLNTGVFANPTTVNAGTIQNPFIIPNPDYIPNADGSQLAYIAGQYSTTPITVFNPFTQSNGTFTPTSRFFQTPSSPSAQYKTGDSYTLTVGITSSNEQQIDSSAQLLLALYYVDGQQNKVILADTVVTGAQAKSGNILSLKDFTVSLPNVSASLNNVPIGILISTADDNGLTPNNNVNTSGEFDVDNVRLTFVPEPASIGVMMIGAAGLLRRQRR